jgi:mannose-1-phosphate guanylyltransferase
MATVAGRPFLELLLRQLSRHGFERAILAVGYQQDLIRSQLGNSLFGLRLDYSSEASPLGTGGALRQAADLMESDTAVAMNGDSYTDADLESFVSKHANSGAQASVVVVPADGRSDCGLVSVDPNERVLQFDEKQGTARTHFVNAGIYSMSKELLDEIPAGLPISLEREVFPRWLKEGKNIRVFVCPNKCVDIGTPDRYQTAQDVLADAELEVSAPGPEGQK